MNKALLSAALAGMLATGVAASAKTADSGKEKCYGIAKAGRNDCKSANGAHSCQGRSTKDYDPHDFLLVDKGSCAAAGGETKAPAN